MLLVQLLLRRLSTPTTEDDAGNEADRCHGRELPAAGPRDDVGDGGDVGEHAARLDADEVIRHEACEGQPQHTVGTNQLPLPLVK